MLGQGENLIKSAHIGFHDFGKIYRTDCWGFPRHHEMNGTFGTIYIWATGIVSWHDVGTAFGGNDPNGDPVPDYLDASDYARFILLRCNNHHALDNWEVDKENGWLYSKGCCTANNSPNDDLMVEFHRLQHFSQEYDISFSFQRYSGSGFKLRHLQNFASKRHITGEPNWQSKIYDKVEHFKIRFTAINFGTGYQTIKISSEKHDFPDPGRMQGIFYNWKITKNPTDSRRDQPTFLCRPGDPCYDSGSSGSYYYYYGGFGIGVNNL